MPGHRGGKMSACSARMSLVFISSPSPTPNLPQFLPSLYLCPLSLSLPLLQCPWYSRDLSVVRGMAPCLDSAFGTHSQYL